MIEKRLKLGTPLVILINSTYIDFLKLLNFGKGWECKNRRWETKLIKDPEKKTLKTLKFSMWI